MRGRRVEREVESEGGLVEGLLRGRRTLLRYPPTLPILPDRLMLHSSLPSPPCPLLHSPYHTTWRPSVNPSPPSTPPLPRRREAPAITLITL